MQGRLLRSSFPGETALCQIFTPGLFPDCPPPRLPTGLSPGWPHPSRNGASPCLIHQKGQQGLCTKPGFQETFPACLLRNRPHRLPTEQLGHSFLDLRCPCFPGWAREQLQGYGSHDEAAPIQSAVIKIPAELCQNGRRWWDAHAMLCPSAPARKQKGTVFVTLSGSSAQEFKCHQLDLLHLPLLEEFILLGDKQTSLADALRILTMPSHAGTQTPVKPTVCPKTLLGLLGRLWGGSWSSPCFWLQALWSHSPLDPAPRPPGTAHW